MNDRILSTECEKIKMYLIKEFALLGRKWEEYIEFIEIKSFIEASHCLEDMQISIINI